MIFSLLRSPWHKLPFAVAIIFLLTATSNFSAAQKIKVNNFDVEVSIAAYTSPTKITFTADGTLWSTNKNGLVNVATSNKLDERPRTILNLENVICENSERGLQSIAPQPNFDPTDTTKNFIFVTYNRNVYDSCDESATIGPVLRLSRFQCPGTNMETFTCDSTSEVVYLQTPSFPKDHHNGADVAFSATGEHLYATIGDGGVSEFSQDLTNLFGAVIRLNSADGSIPFDNPYTTNDDTSIECRTLEPSEATSNRRQCREIFSIGLRNPFRFAMNPNMASQGVTEYYINDVGAAKWEEVSVGGEGYARANYGWHSREGPCKRGSRCGSTECRPGTSDGYVDPIHYYEHNDVGDGAITGGTFVPNWATTWPPEYHGKYIYTDFVFGEIYVLEQNPGSGGGTCPPKSDYDAVPLFSWARSFIVSMDFSPKDHMLYFVSRGYGGRLSRIKYIGPEIKSSTATFDDGTIADITIIDDGDSPPMVIPVGGQPIDNFVPLANRAPQPIIETSSVGGPMGSYVIFDGTGSFDPDGDVKLKYEWDFDGDGVIDSTKPVEVHQFNTEGIFDVTLKVRDGKGGRTTTSTKIGIGTYPTIDILTPKLDETFYVGEEFILVGTATGPDLPFPDLVNTTMVWEVRQHHSDHWHPYLEPTTGNHIRLQPAPSPEDFLASTNSHLEVILSVTNNKGLTSTLSRIVMPEKRNVWIDSFPAGMNVTIDGYNVTAPDTIVSWVNHPLEITANDNQGDDGSLDWLYWNMGGNQTQIVTIPSSATDPALHIIAVYAETESPTKAPVFDTLMPTSMPSTAASMSPSVRATNPKAIDVVGSDSYINAATGSTQGKSSSSATRRDGFPRSVVSFVSTASAVGFVSILTLI